MKLPTPLASRVRASRPIARRSPRRFDTALCPLLALSLLTLGLHDSHARKGLKNSPRSKRSEVTPLTTPAQTLPAQTSAQIPATDQAPPKKFRLPFRPKSAAQDEPDSPAPKAAEKHAPPPVATPAATATSEGAAPARPRFRLFKRSDPPASATPDPTPPTPEITSSPPAAPEKPKKTFLFGFRPRANDDEKLSSSAPSKSSSPRRSSWFRKEAPKPLPEETATIVRVQIFLDNQNFGPGKIDGGLGGFTETAALFYNRSRGVEDENWYYLLKDSEKTVSEIYRPYTIRNEDWRYVGSLPYSPPDQAKRSYMPYRSMREFVAERFHVAEKYLKAINPGRSLSKLKTGDTVIVPNVEPFRIEAIKKNHHYKSAASLSHRHVVIDTKQKMAFIMQDKSQQNLVAAFPVTPGHQRYIPYGNWNIETMVTTPSFRYDKQMLSEGVRGEDFHMLPPGPNSPVGIFWAGLTKSGIGMHGTNSPETIGRARSSGCIRLANWDVVRLSNLIRPGATVHVK